MLTKNDLKKILEISIKIQQTRNLDIIRTLALELSERINHELTQIETAISPNLLSNNAHLDADLLYRDNQQLFNENHQLNKNNVQLLKNINSLIPQIDEKINELKILYSEIYS